ncbi:hypothetical protein CY34DRAFT_798568 [Suillus luteus UH-Slu-Lm8-n1]|uniref:Unplaced genomic scaffold CY34scaffold_9, whole genome shotgun sequence n=1 Tax=Suillus luteus UH-Slu-Lm8-n1 TaxID=930992 RepID=A0A0D0BZJ2_9AGAM|nr:hypothetical protein CY34DRAFT_798568 [Suillus luteus UH-Slu-Lm8-n1]
MCISNQCKQHHSAHLRAAPTRADLAISINSILRSSQTRRLSLMAGPTPWPSSAPHLHWRPQTRMAQATPQNYTRPKDAHLPPSLSPTTWFNPRG